MSATAAEPAVYQLIGLTCFPLPTSAIQFGAKPLFEQVTVKFSDGNRYGLIGANGSGKSTLMKCWAGISSRAPATSCWQAGMRLGKLNQNQFGYEDERVLDVVMRGHMELWAAMKERDRIYADPMPPTMTT